MQICLVLFCHSFSPIVDRYEHRTMLQISEATKLKEEAKAIDVKIGEIQIRLRDNMKKYS